MKKVILGLAIVFSVGVVFTSCKSEKKETKKEQTEKTHTKDVAAKDVYQCPMDCEEGKTYEKEGKCPVCKMKLKKKVKESHDDNHEGHNH